MLCFFRFSRLHFFHQSLCRDLDLYISGTIFGHFCNGAGRAQCRYIFKNISKKNSLCCSILQSLFQIFKNWLKCISALTAYVWGAAPCSALPTADENAVTESAVTTVSSSLFQSVFFKFY